jgi:hypothetical protein
LKVFLDENDPINGNELRFTNTNLPMAMAVPAK